MSIYIGSSICLLLLFSVCSPGILSAQNNHCIVKKSPLKISMDSGKVIYTAQCLTCHQADGLGVSYMNPPLGGSKRVLGDKKVLIEIVIKGLSSHEEIDGKKYQNVMPAHPDMTDAEIADVLTYIRRSFGNKVAAVKIADVKTVRKQLK